MDKVNSTEFDIETVRTVAGLGVGALSAMMLGRDDPRDLLARRLEEIAAPLADAKTRPFGLSTESVVEMHDNAKRLRDLALRLALHSYR